MEIAFQMLFYRILPNSRCIYCLQWESSGFLFIFIGCLRWPGFGNISENKTKSLFLMVETDSKQIHDTVTLVGGSVYFVLCTFLSRISGYGHLLKYFSTSSFHWSCLEKQALACHDTTFSWFPALVFRLLKGDLLYLFDYFISFNLVNSLPYEV